MADQADDVGMPIRPGRRPVQPTIPARIAELSRSTTPGNEPNKSTDPSPSKPWTDQAERRTMVVGREISLSGDIRSCDRLVVEGSVEATLHDCREMEIAERGMFKGKASIEQAEVSGQFEGELVVSKRLLIRSTGHVSGTITYGEIEIERGGKVSGVVQAQQANGALPSAGIARAGK
jgi:cytoskeletal protein CcmA (bactofilin family)